MNKAEEQIFRGIHYIRLEQLESDQKELFLQWLPTDQVIKIQIDQRIYPDCVQFHHYEHWFDNIRPAMLREQREAHNPDLGISVQ